MDIVQLRLLAIQGVVGLSLSASLLMPLWANVIPPETSHVLVDGEYGILEVYGNLVDSPCQMTMDSLDQTVDLGTLSSADLRHPGSRSEPVKFTLRLRDCLVTSGLQNDERTAQIMRGQGQPIVNVAFLAPADLMVTSLIKVNGAKGIALRLSDSHNQDVRLGSLGKPQMLNPGDNQLSWSVSVERTTATLEPGAFYAVADFRLNYD